MTVGFNEIDLGTVRAITVDLPGEWETTQPHGTAITITRDDGLTLLFYRENDGKVKITLSDIPHEYVRYNERRPSIGITLTPTRSRIIARDITRRLLPDAEMYFATIQSRIADTAVYEAKRDSVETMLGLDLTDGRGRINEGATWGDIAVYSDSVTMNLHSLHPEQAKAIMEILRTV